MQNPKFCLVKEKEAHFFNTDAYHGGAEAYARHFAHHKRQPVIGDMTPAYCRPLPLERIAKMLPDVKITVCFRHPVTRAWSHYFHAVRLMNPVGPFLDVLKLNHVESGLGGRTLRMLYELFPRENILTLIYERDFRDIETAYRKVCAFLDVPAGPIDPNFTAGRGFVPSITLPQSRGMIKDSKGVHLYRPGDAVIETLRDANFYEAIVKRGGAEKYRKAFDGVTWSLDSDGIAKAWEPFQDDADLLRSLLGDPLKEWDSVTSLKAPAKVQSRLGTGATIISLLSLSCGAAWFARKAKAD